MRQNSGEIKALFKTVSKIVRKQSRFAANAGVWSA
jgi:hypothetical protein